MSQQRPSHSFLGPRCSGSGTVESSSLSWSFTYGASQDTAPFSICPGTGLRCRRIETPLSALSPTCSVDID